MEGLGSFGVVINVVIGFSSVIDDVAGADGLCYSVFRFLSSEVQGVAYFFWFVKT